MAVGQREQVYRGRHVTVDYQPDRASIAALAVGPEIRAIVHDVAARPALPYALALAPVGRAQRTERGGEQPTAPRYKESFEVDDTTVMVVGAGIYPLLRAAANLVNQAPHALIVEKGNSKFGGHHVMDRTLAHLLTLGLDARRSET